MENQETETMLMAKALVAMQETVEDKECTIESLEYLLEEARENWMLLVDNQYETSYDYESFANKLKNEGYDITTEDITETIKWNYCSEYKLLPSREHIANGLFRLFVSHSVLGDGSHEKLTKTYITEKGAEEIKNKYLERFKCQH